MAYAAGMVWALIKSLRVERYEGINPSWRGTEMIWVVARSCVCGLTVAMTRYAPEVPNRLLQFPTNLHGIYWRMKSDSSRWFDASEIR
jgi:hypothetical protein